MNDLSKITVVLPSLDPDEKLIAVIVVLLVILGIFIAPLRLLFLLRRRGRLPIPG